VSISGLCRHSSLLQTTSSNQASSSSFPRALSATVWNRHGLQHLHSNPIREELKGKEPASGSRCCRRTGGIIHSSIILQRTGRYCSLLSPLEGFGFAIALAVVLDAMVVRTYLVPAIMSLLGLRAWWGPNDLEESDSTRRARQDLKQCLEFVFVVLEDS